MRSLLVWVLVASFALWGGVHGAHADPVANAGPVESAVLPAEAAIAGEPDASEEWVVFTSAVHAAVALYIFTPDPMDDTYPDDPWEEYPEDYWEIMEDPMDDIYPDDPWEEYSEEDWETIDDVTEVLDDPWEEYPEDYADMMGGE